MYKRKTIAVVIPAYNEEQLITKTIETLPEFIDHVIVVNDNSKDSTRECVEKIMKESSMKIELINHETNKGVGASIISGYKRAIALDLDIAVVMAGDAQMEPNDLPKILDPVAEGKVDYAKGNRLFNREVLDSMPKFRFFGNALLSLLTKIASGYWHIADSQSGYTAISTKILRRLNLEKIYPRYGYCNDLLVKLNVSNAVATDVYITPIYGEEKSGIRIGSYMLKVGYLLLKLFFWRLKEKYIIRDFHPLVFFYSYALSALFVSALLFLKIIIDEIFYPPQPEPDILAVLLFITGLQSLFFSMWFDMEYNKHLNPRLVD